MLMKMLKFSFKDDNEMLSSNSGLVLTGLLLKRADMTNRMTKAHVPAVSNATTQHLDIVKSMVRLLTLGKFNNNDMEPNRDDPFFAKSRGLSSVPASPRLRQRFNDAGDVISSIVKEESTRSAEPTRLEYRAQSFNPLDIDVPHVQLQDEERKRFLHLIGVKNEESA
jgi:hypothetical protein